MAVELNGLERYPFSILAPRHLYLGVSHRKALADLHYGIDYDDELQLLLADDGLGKTTLLRCLEQSLHSDARAWLFSSTDSTDLETLKGLLSDVNVEAPGTIAVSQDEQSSQRSTSSGDPARSLILLLDDAQELDTSILTGAIAAAKRRSVGKPHVSLVLAGRPDLLDKLQNLNLAEDFSQTWIAPLSAVETQRYISHRLQLAASGQESVFTPAVTTLIAEESAGVPQAINQLCLAALTTGVTRPLRPTDTAIIANEHVDEISQPIGQTGSAPFNAELHLSSSSSRNRPPFYSRALLLVFITIMVGVFWRHRAASLRSGGPTGSQTAHLPESVAPQELRDSTTVNSPDSGVGATLTSTLPGRDSPRSESQVSPSSNNSILVRPGAAAPGNAADAGGSSSASPNNQAKEQPELLPASRIANSAVDTQQTRVQTDIGDDYMQRGQYDKAIASYKEALVTSPGDAQLQGKIARARQAKATEERILPLSTP